MAHRLTAIGPSDTIDSEVFAFLEARGYTGITTTITVSLPSGEPEHTCLRFTNARIGATRFIDSLKIAHRIHIASPGAEVTIRLNDAQIFLIYGREDSFFFGSIRQEDFLILCQHSLERTARSRIASLLKDYRDNPCFEDVRQNLSYEQAVHRIGWDWRNPENDNASA